MSELVIAHKIIELLRDGPPCPVRSHGKGNWQCELREGHLDAVVFPPERRHVTVLPTGRRYSWRSEADEQWVRKAGAS